jgi:hypothetical protein
MRRRYLGGVALAVELVLLAGCATLPPVESIEPSPSGNPVFEGTPEEYMVLKRACLEDEGIKTADLPPGDPEAGFLVDNRETTREELEAATNKCTKKIGEPKISNLSESELRKRYDARISQYDCLTENGLVSGYPPSFDVFVSDYERSGERILWEPTEGATTTERDGKLMGPTDVCPPSTKTW